MALIITLISVVNFVARVLSLIVLIDVVLSYFLPPYNGLRLFLDGIVNPMLAPIRRVVPPIGGLDLSPIVLLILIQVIAYIITQILLFI